MTRAIWKFPLPTRPGVFELSMPVGARFLNVQLQRGNPFVWAIVDPTAAVVQVGCEALMTGPEIDLPATHYFIGTALLDGGLFVLHYFAVAA